ncbi:unnamed protein product [Colias eurytheme]|nr:unnamed protein product [Colias eurytheme]
MKVKLAAQVLSHSVAAGMYSKIATGDMPSDATPTANLIAKMDMLFDSVNAYTPDLRGKKFSTNIKERTEHIALFREMKVIFKNLVFLECRSQPPSKEGWIWTLNGLELV